MSPIAGSFPHGSIGGLIRQEPVYQTRGIYRRHATASRVSRARPRISFWSLALDDMLSTTCRRTRTMYLGPQDEPTPTCLFLRPLLRQCERCPHPVPGMVAWWNGRPRCSWRTVTEPHTHISSDEGRGREISISTHTNTDTEDGTTELDSSVPREHWNSRAGPNCRQGRRPSIECLVVPSLPTSPSFA